MYEHEDYGSIAPSSLGEEGEGVGMVEELIAKRPIHSTCRWNGEGEDIECCHQINVLELLWFPHSMHNFTVIT